MTSLRSQPPLVTELITRNIVELASTGERDQICLSELAIKILGLTRPLSLP